jgi:SAM-dependent methyltransferase
MPVDSPALAFSATADAYERTMAAALRPLCERAVALADLQPGERVLDIGTGTGTAAGLAAGDGRTVVGVDAAPGMLAIARRLHPGLELVEADFTAMPFDDASFDVALCVHALQFGRDRVAALREWLRIIRPGGRIVVSLPGPPEATWIPVIRDAYESHGIGQALTSFPDEAELRAMAEDAGWVDVDTTAEADHAVDFAHEGNFHDWMVIGARGTATATWTPEQRAAFEAELLALARTPAGGYRLPFGALFLTARRAAA